VHLDVIFDANVYIKPLAKRESFFHVWLCHLAAIGFHDSLHRCQDTIWTYGIRWLCPAGSLTNQTTCVSWHSLSRNNADTAKLSKLED